MKQQIAMPTTGQFVAVWEYGGKVWSSVYCWVLVDDAPTLHIQAGYRNDGSAIWNAYEDGEPALDVLVDLSERIQIFYLVTEGYSYA